MMSNITDSAANKRKNGYEFTFESVTKTDGGTSVEREMIQFVFVHYKLAIDVKLENW